MLCRGSIRHLTLTHSNERHKQEKQCRHLYQVAVSDVTRGRSRQDRGTKISVTLI